MNLTTIIAGIGIVCYILVYIATKLEEKHAFLKFLFISFSLFTMLLIPKVSLDNKNYCSFEISNTTVLGDYVGYNYDYFCRTNTNNTIDTFYKSYLTILIVFAIYIVVFFSKEIIEYLQNIGK